MVLDMELNFATFFVLANKSMVVELFHFLDLRGLVAFDSAVCCHDLRPKMLTCFSIDHFQYDGSENKAVEIGYWKWLTLRRVFVSNSRIWSGCDLLLLDAILEYDAISNGFQSISIYGIPKNIGFGGIGAILSGKCRKTLKTLHLVGFDFEESYTQAPNEIQSCLSLCHNLSELELYEWEYPFSGINLLSAQHSTLRKLHLYLNNITDDGVKDIVTKCPLLEDLMIYGEGMSRTFTDVALNAIAEHCTALKIVDLWGFPAVSCAGIVNFIHKRGANLVNLTLPDFIDDENSPEVEAYGNSILTEIANRCPQLESFDVAMLQCTSDALQLLARACRKLKVLSLQESALDENTLVKFVSNCPSLSELDLSDNYMIRRHNMNKQSCVWDDDDDDDDTDSTSVPVDQPDTADKLRAASANPNLKVIV